MALWIGPNPSGTRPEVLLGLACQPEKGGTATLPLAPALLMFCSTKPSLARLDFFVNPKVDFFFKVAYNADVVGI